MFSMPSSLMTSSDVKTRWGGPSARHYSIHPDSQAGKDFKAAHEAMLGTGIGANEQRAITDSLGNRIGTLNAYSTRQGSGLQVYLGKQGVTASHGGTPQSAISVIVDKGKRFAKGFNWETVMKTVTTAIAEGRIHKI